ncbi:ubiquitin fusion degradation protein [Physocladia obscura]|uniref:Ubiquitin fusion degradation protein n=1 Tax=Physocladia obscura TaxID=109957 RepID=A0AAD5SRM8_9FUNG|nr:ubiquitin fusion degradation protein [Physocladia obscura]
MAFQGMDWEGINANTPMLRAINRSFNEYYRCYSIALMPGNERENINYGGKTTLNIAYPMLFEITNEQHKTHSSHAGVLEFIAEEGRAYLPQWMMNTLLIEEGSLARIKNVSLPLGKFVKLQPQSVDFLDITDPKAVLERAISQFSCLTQNDIITIKYNNKLFDILIVETRPGGGKGISVVETDLEVDFDAPVGYKEPERVVKKHVVPADSMSSLGSHTVSEEKTFSAFHGSGQRLNGKARNDDEKGDDENVKFLTPTPAANSVDSKLKAVPAALYLPHGKLFFGYPIVPLKKLDEESAVEPEKFTGTGQTLRASKKK